MAARRWTPAPRGHTTRPGRRHLGGGCPKSSKSWMTILVVLKPYWNLWWLGDLPFFKTIYLYIYNYIYTYRSLYIQQKSSVSCDPDLVQSNRPYWSSTCCLHTTHEWNTYFPNDCIHQIHSDKSVSYLQRAGKRLNANNCSCTAICPSKVYPNILLEYPKRTNATIREGENTLIF
jgi:hypothetical protein